MCAQVRREEPEQPDRSVFQDSPDNKVYRDSLDLLVIPEHQAPLVATDCAVQRVQLERLEARDSLEILVRVAILVHQEHQAARAIRDSWELRDLKDRLAIQECRVQWDREVYQETLEFQANKVSLTT